MFGQRTRVYARPTDGFPFCPMTAIGRVWKDARFVSLKKTTQQVAQESLHGSRFKIPSPLGPSRRGHNILDLYTPSSLTLAIVAHNTCRAPTLASLAFSLLENAAP